MTGNRAAHKATVGLLMAMVALLAACTGPPSSSSKSPAPGNTAPATGIVQGQNGWSTYTNAELGFAVSFPTKIYSETGSPCLKKQVRGAWSYQATPGMVQATVLQDGGDFWVVQRFSYQPLRPKQLADGTVIFKSCDKVTTTSGMMHFEGEPSDQTLTFLPFTVGPADAQADMRKWLHTIYSSCPRLKVGFTQGTGGAWTNVAYSCPARPELPSGDDQLRWFQDQGLFVDFWLGQSNAIRTNADHSVNRKVAASFAAL